jgi:sulfate/thiosulfate transport system permease protein
MRAVGLSMRRHVLPGFGLTFSYTMLYLSMIILLPISALCVRSFAGGMDAFAAALGDPRVMAAFSLSFGAAVIAAAVNVPFGVVVAWVLVRYRFPGRRLFDAIVDLPFALPTAVGGIALATLYADNGWFGRLLAPLGVSVAFNRLGVVVAMVFIGLPFVIRTVQPVLEDLDFGEEEAAASLGASPMETFVSVILPALWPSITTGFALALARGLGEYGSIIFIAGNMPGISEVVPLLIVIELEQYNYVGASVIAVTMLAATLAILLVINGLQRWQRRLEA